MSRFPWAGLFSSIFIQQCDISTSPKYFFPYNDIQFLPCKCLSHQQFHSAELNSNCYCYSWPMLCFRGKDLRRMNLIMVPFTRCNGTDGKCKH